MRLLLATTLMSTPLLACGAKSAASPSGGTQCPDSQSSCLTAPSCAMDDARQCMMCRCGPATPFQPNDYTPQGPPKGT